MIDKRPELQWLDIGAAIEHCRQGASIWKWAGNGQGMEPDVVLATAGIVPTMELLAATSWLRTHSPELKVRVVNVVDLMCLFPPEAHPHGMHDHRFINLFTRDKPVILTFHGYQRAIHEIIHGRPNAERFHVRGFVDQGTTTTPFGIVVLNRMSRYHLCMEALRRTPGMKRRAPALITECNAMIEQATAYSREHLEDMPEIRNWLWPD